MIYSIFHVTKFRYSAPVSESVIEVRMQPRSEMSQRCLNFELTLRPAAPLLSYREYSGNIVHHFDIPGAHSQLIINAKSLVEMQPLDALPESLALSAWDELDELIEEGDFWEMLMPSHFAHSSELLKDFASELNLNRREDPLTLLRRLNTKIHDAFAYVPQSTRVDSPIDDALKTRQGVCQDFSNIMIALARELRIPCRYVSGYLFHGAQYADRSAEDATHAWVEALLPELGWIGFDPTNNVLAGERHIRVAVGRDYADVPPTRGVSKGSAESHLSVAVQVKPISEKEEKIQAMLGYTEQIDPDQTLLQQQQQQQQ